MLTSALLWQLYRHTLRPAADPLPTELRTLSGGGIAARSAKAARPAGRTITHDGVDVTKL